MDRKFDGAPNRSWEGMSGSRYSDPMTLMVVYAMAVGQACAATI